MKRLEVVQGYIEGYSCDNCNSYNDILRRYCWNCNSHRDKDENLYNAEWNCIIRRGLVISWVGYLTGFISMNDEKRAELHSKFFNKAMNDIENKTYAELVDWEEQLEEIVIEGRAGIQASREVRRKKAADMTKEERDRLITRPDMTTSDGLNAPKIRKDRQSSADKMVAQFAGMGISAEDINKLMGAIIPAKTAVSEKKPREESFSFNKDEETPKTNGVIKPSSITTQEMLLDEVLGQIDLSSDNIVFLEHKVSTAWILVPKTQSKIPPEKLIAAQNRLDELKTPKIVEKSSTLEVAVMEPNKNSPLAVIEPIKPATKTLSFLDFLKK